MKESNIKLLYYLAWAIGLVTAGFLIYGIIKSLI